VCGSDCLQEFAERFLFALTNGKPAAVPLAPDVRYTENGSVLAIGDALWATAQGLGANKLVFTDPASGGIQLYAAVAGMLVIVTSISHRRYLVVDEENQVVSAIATFDHRGNLSSVPMPRGRTVTPSGPFARPFSFLIFESFKLIDGRIRQIEATVHSVPYRMHPGWPAE
jgi:hypothetical protein